MPFIAAFTFSSASTRLMPVGTRMDEEEADDTEETEDDDDGEEDATLEEVEELVDELEAALDVELEEEDASGPSVVSKNEVQSGSLGQSIRPSPSLSLRSKHS